MKTDCLQIPETLKSFMDLPHKISYTWCL